MGIFLFTLIFNLNTAQASDWSKDALKLSGESDLNYQKTIERLKANPSLDEELKDVLNLPKPAIETYLALDVISVLKRESLFQDLFFAAKKDRSGFFLIALNSFFNSTHHDLIIQFYRDILKDDLFPVSLKVVVLDTFGRIHFRIPLSSLKKNLQNKNEPELQDAALSYLRAFVKTNDPEYVSFLHEIELNHQENPTQESLNAQLKNLISETKDKK